MASLNKILLVLSVLLIVCTADNPRVQTPQGTIEGLEKKYDGQTVYQFLGIPYASPPVGDLRFKRPIVHPVFTDVFKAQQFGPSCTQHILGNDAWLLPNRRISEDCLLLHIYVPTTLQPSQNRSVMVWIHGGGFEAGQGMLYDGSYLALQGDVIVVTINYRLGVFGFLSTGDSAAAGNYGLWDQHFAIQWVFNNIGSFGGDSHSITIFGESAGGYSVGLHMVSPLSRSFIKRAISESGTVFSPRSLALNPKPIAVKIGDLLHCDKTNTSALVECLRKVSATDLKKAEDSAAQGPPGKLTFPILMAPVIDGQLVADVPEKSLMDNRSASYEMFHSIDVLAGTNNAEGGLLYFRLIQFQQQYNFNITEGIPTRVLCDVVAPAVARDFFNNSQKVSAAICKKFTVNNTGSADFLQRQARSIVNIYADLNFIVPTVRTLMAHSNTTTLRVHKKSYQYLFSHQPSYPWIQSRPPWLQGANHAGEVPFVFGLDAMYPKNKTKSAQEKQLSTTMMKYWSNFAKTGDPNGPGLPKWQQFNVSETDYMYMDLTFGARSKPDLYADRMVFWLETVPNLLNDVTESAPAISSSRSTRPPSYLPVGLLMVLLIAKCNS